MKVLVVFVSVLVAVYALADEEQWKSFKVFYDDRILQKYQIVESNLSKNSKSSNVFYFISLKSYDIEFAYIHKMSGENH